MRAFRNSSGGFRRNQLRSVVNYFDMVGIKLVGRGTWMSSLCPFHQDTKPSLHVRAETGAFRCMACGVRGGDVLAFHRMRTGLGFVQAARQLGAWEER